METNVMELVRTIFHLPVTSERDSLAFRGVLEYLKKGGYQTGGWVLQPVITGFTYTTDNPAPYKGYWLKETEKEEIWIYDDIVLLYFDYPSQSSDFYFIENIQSIKTGISGIYKKAGAGQFEIYCILESVCRP